MVLSLSVCEFLNRFYLFYIPGDPFKSYFWFGKDGIGPLTFPSEDLGGGGGGRVVAGKALFKEAASASVSIIRFQTSA